MPTINLVTVKLDRSTGYSAEKDWFHDLCNEVYQVFVAKRAELIRKYRNTDLVDKFVHYERSDNDGEEGFFYDTLRMPETDAKEFVASLRNRFDDNDLRYCYDSCKIGYPDEYGDVCDKPNPTKVTYKKVKPMSDGQLAPLIYGQIYFALPDVKAYGQNFVNGTARDEVICMPGFPITKATFLKIFTGCFLRYHQTYFANAVRNKKFVQKTRKDAQYGGVARVDFDNMSVDNVKALLAWMRRGYASYVQPTYYKFNYKSGNHEHYLMKLTDQEKIDLVATVLANKKKKLAEAAKQQEK